MPEMENTIVARLVDENTLDFNGTLFVRKSGGRSDEEVLLMPMDNTMAPRLRCTNCGYERNYHYWYKGAGFTERIVGYCPGCGYHILGTLGQTERQGGER